ncbi:DUF819 family protein, partial [Pyxidicoccus fallax]
MMAPLQVLVVVGLPGLILLAARHWKPVAWVGPVVLCYGAGILLGNVPGLGLQSRVSLSVSEAAVPLAIPLLLFATDMPRWMRLARSTLLSFVLACVAAMVSAAVVGRAFADRSDEWWKMAGMLAGVYTGGTANMNAVGLALQVREETFVLLNTADIVCGAAYFLFLVTVAQRLVLAFLPRFPNPTGWSEPTETGAGEARFFTRARVRGMALSLLLAVVICAASAGGTLGVLG